MKLHNDINRFVSLNPAHYRFLKSISFDRSITSSGLSGYEVELILVKISDEATEELKIRCINARDIRIAEIDSMAGMWLDIEDLTNHQLEGISYRVSEQENNTFSFTCSDFFVELIN